MPCRHETSGVVQRGGDESWFTRAARGSKSVSFLRAGVPRRTWKRFNAIRAPRRVYRLQLYFLGRESTDKDPCSHIAAAVFPKNAHSYARTRSMRSYLLIMLGFYQERSLPCRFASA